MKSVPSWNPAVVPSSATAYTFDWYVNRTVSPVVVLADAIIAAFAAAPTFAEALKSDALKSVNVVPIVPFAILSTPPTKSVILSIPTVVVFCAVITNLSAPAPPVNVSTPPVPPFNVSFPAPPMIVSLRVEPVNVSFPAPPVIVTLLADTAVNITSAFAVDAS